MVAAQIVSRRAAHRSVALSSQDRQHDRDDELMAVVTCEELEEDPSEPKSLADGPVNISSDILMGKMPKADKILKKGLLSKLTPAYEWKRMDVALTNIGLFFSKPGEDSLRDLIPLYEVVEVKRRDDIPGGEGKSISAEKSPQRTFSNRSASARSLKLNLMNESGVEPLHIIQIRTVDDGYNRQRPRAPRTLPACRPLSQPPAGYQDATIERSRVQCPEYKAAEGPNSLGPSPDPRPAVSDAAPAQQRATKSRAREQRAHLLPQGRDGGRVHRVAAPPPALHRPRRHAQARSP